MINYTCDYVCKLLHWAEGLCVDLHNFLVELRWSIMEWEADREIDEEDKEQ